MALSRNDTFKRRQGDTMAKGFDHACRLGYKPNYQLTIQWRLTAFVDNARDGMKRVKNNAREWLKRRGVPPVWIYSREREGNRTSEHLHVSIYCPDEYAEGLQEAVDHWAESFDGHAVLLKPFDNKPWRNARTWTLGYILAGGNPAVRERYPYKGKKSHQQGTLEGKRVGTSRMLGAKAIADYMAAPLVDVPKPKADPAITKVVKSSKRRSAS